jgi:hypothetical protein
MKYGNLTLLEEKWDKNDKILCRCDCGVEKRLDWWNVKSGNTSSCGCLKKKMMAICAKRMFTGKTPVNFIDYSGKRIGSINVLKRIHDVRLHTTTYLVQCDCGTEFDVEISNLRKGKYLKCSCGPNKHPLKNVLQRMIDRCTNPSEKSFKWYGGKGIKVYEEWMRFPIKFIQWSEKNGWMYQKNCCRKDKLCIDRINSNKDYCPENCQWITISKNSIKAMEFRYSTENQIKECISFLKEHGYTVNEPRS